MGWTNEQRRVIDHREGSLIVSAAAGSGKTAVLIEHIVSRILEGESVENFLVMTFSNAAAAEMKKRLADKLEDTLTKEKDPKMQEYLRGELEKLPESSVSTVHSFCMDLLKKYAAAAQLDPTFRVAADEEKALFWSDALEDTLEQLYTEKDPDFMECAACWGGRDGTGLSSLVRRVRDFCMARPEGIGLTDILLSKYMDNVVNPVRSLAFEELRNRWKIILRDTKKELESLKEETEALNLVKAVATLEKDIAGLTVCLSALEEKEEDYPSLALGKWPSIRKDNEEKEIYEFYKGKRNDALDFIKDPFKKTQKLLNRSRNSLRMAGALRGLILTVKRAEEAYFSAKKARGLMDFDDLEHEALKLLKDESIVKELQARYHAVFVDEYQDTNRVQEAIACAVAREDNLFTVGDIKQSIYRFRQAEPLIFRERCERSSEDGIQHRIDLNKNFRSHPGVIEGVNAVFKTIMSTDLGDVEYDDTQMLYTGSARPDAELDTEPVRMILVPGKSQDNDMRILDNVSEELRDMEKAEKCAAAIMQEIGNLIGRELWDSKAQQTRTLGYKDIAVLTRTRESGATVADYLRKHGVPAVTSAEASYFDKAEIDQVIQCLRWIDHPKRDLAMITTLHSAMGSFSAQELLEIRSILPGSKQPFWKAAAKYASEKGNALAGKLSAFLAKVDHWRKLSGCVTVEQLIRTVYEDTGFYDRIGVTLQGEQRQADLRLLCRKARSLEDTGGRTLYGFLRYVNDIREKAKDVGGSGSPVENAVQIMTIHASKGLEFPVVFMIDLDKLLARPNPREKEGELLMDDDLGFAPREYYIKSRRKTESFLYEAVKEKGHMAELSEEVRLLYVAMTRPRERLYLVMEEPDPKKLDEFCKPVTTLSLAKTMVHFSDWLLTTAVRYAKEEDFPNCDELRSCHEGRLTFPWRIIRDVKAEGTQLPVKESGELDEILKGRPSVTVAKALEWQYKYPSGVRPEKTTATALLKREELPTNFSRKEVSENLGPLEKSRALNRGTWTHTLMEALRPDTKKARDTAEILLEKGILPEEARGNLDIAGAEAFLKHPVMKRIAESPEVLREQPFVLKIDPEDQRNLKIPGEDGITVQGLCDLAWREEDGWILIDYKTNRVDEGNEHALLEHYTIQLQIYSLALEKLTGFPVKRWGLYLTRARKIIWNDGKLE